jgi:hypothetical protein
MKKQRESILKLLELKNEQSFYIKQRQDKKIINFLKTLPTTQIEEFNKYNTNTFSEISLEMSFYAIKKQIKLINILYNTNNNKLDNNFYNKELTLFNPNFFAHIVSDMAEDNAFEKYYDRDKNYTSLDENFEHNLLLDLNEEYIKNHIFQWISKYFKLLNINEISDNLGDLLNYLSNLNEYDIIFMINNHINNYKPFINCLYLFKDTNNLVLLKEHILDQLYLHRNEKSYLFNDYKNEKLNAKDIHELFESKIQYN